MLFTEVFCNRYERKPKHSAHMHNMRHEYTFSAGNLKEREHLGDKVQMRENFEVNLTVDRKKAV